MITCVDKFKILGNAATQFAPGYAPVPWAVIKILLQVCLFESLVQVPNFLDEHQRHYRVGDGVEELTSTIARCAIFEAVYMKHVT